jgi:hypothetical protein
VKINSAVTLGKESLSCDDQEFHQYKLALIIKTFSFVKINSAVTLGKESLNCDDQEFHQYQQTTPITSNQ